MLLSQVFTLSGRKTPHFNALVSGFHPVWEEDSSLYLSCLRFSPCLGGRLLTLLISCLRFSPCLGGRLLTLLILSQVFTLSGRKTPHFNALVSGFHPVWEEDSSLYLSCLRFSPCLGGRLLTLMLLSQVFTLSGRKTPHFTYLVSGFHPVWEEDSSLYLSCLRFSPCLGGRLLTLLILSQVFTLSGRKTPHFTYLVSGFHPVWEEDSSLYLSCLRFSPCLGGRMFSPCLGGRLLTLMLLSQVFTLSGRKTPHFNALISGFHPVWEEDSSL